MNGFGQTEVVQRRRPERRRDPFDGGEADVAQPDERLQTIDDVRREVLCGQRLHRAPDVQLQGGERLAQLVMQLSRDLHALGLARVAK